MSESSKLEELKTQTQNLGKAYRELFPKVDPAFVYDLILRLSKNSDNNTPIYTVEVFTKEGTNPEKSKERILQTTGTVPAIFDNGTHYVSTQRMTLEMLKKLNDIDYVLEVMGDFTGGASSIGPQHDKGDWKRIRDRSQ
ncbi:MAG TPA: hypothetical protein VK566_00955 [Nitrososphaeraceae archaeon]|jgi:hypothetical protein|nr:hypothetical protein [Nitrososphaeraceae archaeon]